MNLRTWAKNMCKKYDVKLLRFDNLGRNYSYPYNGSIVVTEPNKYVTPNLFKSLVFHEIAHVLNFRNKKYLNYHKKHCSKKYLKKFALRAEVYTEKVAQKLAKENGLIEYKVFYQFTKECREYLKEHYELG